MQHHFRWKRIIVLSWVRVQLLLQLLLCGGSKKPRFEGKVGNLHLFIRYANYDYYPPCLQWGLSGVEWKNSFRSLKAGRGRVGFRSDWNVKFNQRKFKSRGSDAIVPRKLLAGDEFEPVRLFLFMLFFFTDPPHPSPVRRGVHKNHPTDFMCGVMLIFTFRATITPFWRGGGGCEY